MICAHVVDVGLKKVPGADSVTVSLNPGSATVKLKPGNMVRMPQLWEIVRKNGFTPKTTRIVVRGRAQGDTFTADGTNETFMLKADPKSPAAFAELKRHDGQTVMVNGTLTPQKDVKKPVPLIVERVELK